MSGLDALAVRVLHDFRRRDELTCYAHRSNQHADEIRMQEAFRDLVAPDLSKEVERLRVYLQGAIELIDSGKVYDQMCCGGHMCGCQGATHADEFLHYAREAVSLSKGEDDGE